MPCIELAECTFQSGGVVGIPEVANKVNLNFVVMQLTIVTVV